MGGVDEALEIIGAAQVGADRVQVEGPVTMVASVGVCQDVSIPFKSLTLSSQFGYALSTTGVIQMASKPMPWM
jgi:hypothetical protein